jgi:hypothetical protein
MHKALCIKVNIAGTSFILIAVTIIVLIENLAIIAKVSIAYIAAT